MINEQQRKQLVQAMMESQVKLAAEHKHTGATCYIALDKNNDDIIHLVPCLTQPGDLEKLAQKLQQSAQKLFALAKIMAEENKQAVH